MIITIGSTKGGVGKSTIACNLAAVAAAEGKKVLLVDADPQASSLNFRALREKDDIKAMAITKPTLHKDLKDFNNFDLIVVDSGGRDSVIFRSAILACDILIIPVLPSVYDIWATQDTIDIVQEAMVYKDKMICRFLLNMVMPKTIMARDTLEALDEQKATIPLLESQLGARAAFKNAIVTGKGICEYEPSSKAGKEFFACYREILSLGDL